MSDESHVMIVKRLLLWLDECAGVEKLDEFSRELNEINEKTLVLLD